MKREVHLKVNGLELEGILSVPERASGVAALAVKWFMRFLFTASARSLPDESRDALEDEVEIPPKFQNSAEKPAGPPGKTRGSSKESYRPLHHK